MNHIIAFGTAAMLALLEKSAGAPSIAQFAVGGMTTVRPATTRVPLLSGVSAERQSLIFFAKHPQKHQQIRMSSPKTT
jgi:hypothetical protein